MQASDNGAYASPAACVARLVESDGYDGLMFRGMGATAFREVPSYTLYFVAFEYVKSICLAFPVIPASLVPLLGGAAAGVASWVPVYPIDVVKTNIQAEVEGGGESFVECASRLWREEGGMSPFWDGLGPKLLRAVVNHAVTFYVFELLTAGVAVAV